MQNFSAPRFKFKLASSNMDLDGLLKASEKAAQARKEQAQAQASSGGGGDTAPTSAAPPVDYNSMFTPLRKLPISGSGGRHLDFSLKKNQVNGRGDREHAGPACTQ
jgi:hypothetical protein